MSDDDEELRIGIRLMDDTSGYCVWIERWPGYMTQREALRFARLLREAAGMSGDRVAKTIRIER